MIPRQMGAGGPGMTDRDSGTDRDIAAKSNSEGKFLPLIFKSMIFS